MKKLNSRTVEVLFANFETLFTISFNINELRI